MELNVELGGGFCGLLTIVFITLKLCGVIHWSWWWVLAPLWIGTALTVAILIVILVVTVMLAFALRK